MTQYRTYFVTSVCSQKPGSGVIQPELFSVLVGSQLLKKTPKWGKSPPGPAHKQASLFLIQTSFPSPPPPFEKLRKRTPAAVGEENLLLSIFCFSLKGCCRRKTVSSGSQQPGWWVLRVGAVIPRPREKCNGWDFTWLLFRLELRFAWSPRGHMTFLTSGFLQQVNQASEAS